MNTKPNICIYCGKNNPETKDHVPPKNLFSKPRPKLITVPCCSDCHKLTTMDDEIFRNMLIMSRNVEKHPEADRIREVMHRSFARPEHINLTRRLIHTIEEVNIPGISKTLYSYRVEKERMDTVVARTVRGLFYDENKIIYPIDGQITVYCINFIDKDKLNLFDKFSHLFNQVSPKVIGNNVFKYQMAKLSEEFLEMWLMCFYESIYYFALLIPPVKSSQGKNKSKLLN